MPTWDAAQYLRFEGDRARPFHDLVARIATPDPREIVDLGCGPGNATRTLLDRFPAARVHGIDSSPEMIAAAGAEAGDRLTFALGDAASWVPEPGSLDVIVSNAALQWVPGHLTRMPDWVAGLRPGGTLAFQVPLPSRPAEIFREIARTRRWAGALGDVAALARDTSVVRPVEDYLDLLAGAGCAVDAWQTTYMHLLPGEDPVLGWYSGTGLRPYLQRLAGDEAAAFRDEVARALREAYPARPYGTVLPFPRLFVVARRAAR